MTINCRKCHVVVTLSAPRCNCLNGIADIRFKNELNADYESLYNEIADSDLEESIQPQELKEAQAKQDIVNLKRVLKGKSGLRVLEIGPGSGHFARELSSFGSVYLGDITPRYIERLEFATGRFVCDVESIPFVDEFDLIVLCDVLEHVLNEGDALLSIQSALKVGGAIYLRCPSNEPLVSYSQRLGSKFPYVHLRTYSRKSMRRALEHTGFRVVQTEYSPAIAIGFSRRNFGIKQLRLARANRFTNEIRYALSGVGTNPRARGLDFVLTRVEAVCWKIVEVLKIAWLRRLITSSWYRPSEVWAIGLKKSALDSISLEINKAE